MEESVANEIKYQAKETVKNVGESVLDISDYDTDLDALKTEVTDIIHAIKAHPDKTLVKKLGQLYTDKGFKEKNPAKYTNKEDLKQVKNAIVEWLKAENITF